MLNAMGIDGRFSIGIKKLLMIIEMARQDVDKAEKFVNALQEDAVRHPVAVLNRPFE
jgi:hypothetical protein